MGRRHPPQGVGGWDELTVARLPLPPPLTTTLSLGKETQKGGVVCGAAHLAAIGVLHHEAQAVVGLEGVLQRLWGGEGARALPTLLDTAALARRGSWAAGVQTAVRLSGYVNELAALRARSYCAERSCPLPSRSLQEAGPGGEDCVLSNQSRSTPPYSSYVSQMC